MSDSAKHQIGLYTTLQKRRLHMGEGIQLRASSWSFKQLSLCCLTASVRREDTIRTHHRLYVPVPEASKREDEGWRL